MGPRSLLPQQRGLASLYFLESSMGWKRNLMLGSLPCTHPMVPWILVLPFKYSWL